MLRHPVTKEESPINLPDSSTSTITSWLTRMEQRLQMLLILFLVLRGTTLHLLQRNKIVSSPIYQTALTRKVWQNVHIGTSSN